MIDFITAAWAAAVATVDVLGSVLALPFSGFTAAWAAVGATVSLLGAVVALPLAGFTAAGVAAGSFAAAVQGWIGNVAAGSLFALLQSAGVVGIAATTKACIAAVGGAVGTAFSYLFS